MHGYFFKSKPESSRQLTEIRLQKKHFNNSKKVLFYCYSFSLLGGFMEVKTKDKYSRKIQITLTEDEYQTLVKLSDLQNRPVATVFMEFVREANTFKVLKKVVTATEKIVRFKDLFKRKNAEISSSIT